MTKRIIYIAYSNLWLMDSLYGINERIGLEGLEPMHESQTEAHVHAGGWTVD